MSQAQDVVDGLEKTEIDSVAKALAAVEAAADACERAKRGREREELLKARNQLSGHLEYLRRKANTPERKPRTPAELARLEKQGDPDCPKGQAYRPRGSQKEIRCTGPQLVDMGWEAAKHYFTSQGYKLTSTEDPPSLRAEYGAELYVYNFARTGDDSPARCLTLYPPPGTSWQEAVARVTGVAPQRLTAPGSVPTRRGTPPLEVEEGDAKLIVRIGDCG